MVNHRVTFVKNFESVLKNRDKCHFYHYDIAILTSVPLAKRESSDDFYALSWYNGVSASGDRFQDIPYITMSEEQKHDLNLLRISAKQREWTTLQDTLKRLFATLDPLIALQVGATRLQAFLPIFEDYYPDAGWVREVMLTVINYASAPNELPEHTVNQFPSPGCGNFVRAVLDSARVVQDKYSVFERYSHATNVVSNCILAELSHHYYQDRMDIFELFIDPLTHQQMRTQIQYDFWLAEDTAKQDTALWLAVADDVERKIKDN